MSGGEGSSKTLTPAEFWDRLEKSITPKSPTTPSSATTPSKSSSQSRGLRVSRRLDFLGVALWSYFFVKLFVADVDRIALRLINPSLEGLVDYRLIAYLAVAAAAVWFTRRKWWRLLYVALFPVVVVFWKLPYLLYRRRSWALFLAVLQTIASISVNLRYRLTAGCAYLAAALVVLFTSAALLVLPALVVLTFVLAVSLIRYVRRTVATPSFTGMQRSWISRILRDDHLGAAWSLSEDLRDPAIQRYSDTQVQTAAMRISTGIALNKVLYVWAYQLDRYRSRYAPALIFAAISFVWLFLTTLLTLALLNFGLFAVAPHEYQVSTDPTFVAFLVYALSTLTGSAGGGVAAVGQIALVIQLASGLTGLLVLLAILLNLGLTLRRERDETATRELANEIRTKAREQEARFVSNYAVSVDEARQRLESFGAGFAFLVTYVTRGIPGDALGSSQDDSDSTGQS